MNTKTVILKERPSSINRKNYANKYNICNSSPVYTKINKSSKSKLEDIDLGSDISHIYRKSKEKKILKENEIRAKARLKIAEYHNKNKDKKGKKHNTSTLSNYTNKNYKFPKKIVNNKKQVTFKKQTQSLTKNKKKHNKLIIKTNPKSKSCSKIANNKKIIYIDKYYKSEPMPESKKKNKKIYKTVNIRTNIDTYKTIDQFLYLDLFYTSIQKNDYYKKFPKFIDKYINSIIAHNFDINYIK